MDRRARLRSRRASDYNLVKITRLQLPPSSSPPAAGTRPFVIGGEQLTNIPLFWQEGRPDDTRQRYGPPRPSSAVASTKFREADRGRADRPSIANTRPMCSITGLGPCHRRGG